MTPLTDFVKQIVVKHIGLQVLPEHYQLLVLVLFKPWLNYYLQKLLTKTFWKLGLYLRNLAKLLIDLEAAEYAKQPWRWFKDFKVTKLFKNVKMSNPFISLQLIKIFYHYQNLNVVNTCVSDGNYLVKNLRFLVNIQCQNSLKKMNINFC